MTRVWEYRFIVGQWTVVFLLVTVYLGSWSFVQKALATLVAVAAVFLLDLGPRPIPVLEDLRKKSITPSSAEHRRACELVLDRLREPILAIETRDEIRTRTGKILVPETGELLPYCEHFPHDLRIQTGRQWAPRAGAGHSVSLRVDSTGNWEIVDVSSWMS